MYNYQDEVLELQLLESDYSIEANGVPTWSPSAWSIGCGSMRTVWFSAGSFRCDCT